MAVIGSIVMEIENLIDLPPKIQNGRQWSDLKKLCNLDSPNADIHAQEILA